MIVLGILTSDPNLGLEKLKNYFEEPVENKLCEVTRHDQWQRVVRLPAGDQSRPKNAFVLH